MNFVIIMDCCQVFAVRRLLARRPRLLAKFPFATWPSHNYLLIVYIMLMASPASRLLLHLRANFIFFSFCFILLRLNYCSPKAINFGSCEPNSETAMDEWANEREKNGTKCPELNCHSQSQWLPWYGCVLLAFFTWRHLGRTNRPRRIRRDLCRIIYTCKRVCCTAIFDRNIYCCCVDVILTQCLYECVCVWCAAKRKQQIRFAEFKNKHWK